jgi:hypothetical protein
VNGSCLLRLSVVPRARPVQVGKLLWVAFGVLALFCGRANAKASGYALGFSEDGLSAWVANDEALNVTRQFTLEAWVKPSAEILGKNIDFVISKQMSGTGYTLLSSAGLPEGEEVFSFESAGIQVHSSVRVSEVVGRWTHLAGVWDGRRLRLYVNGRLRGTLDLAAPPTANAEPLSIGCSPFGEDTDWRGAIDEVRLWSVARTSSEIWWDMLHYPRGNEFGLLAYFPFDEGSGSVFADHAGANDGTLGNPVHPEMGRPDWVAGVGLLSPNADF